MTSLKGQDILALGFMTFALFVGAGNIIFPPIVGLQSGPHVWMAAFGFLITAVGLPVLTVIALAKVGGAMDALSSPIGRTAGVILAAVCYLSVGPLFATPRTATVSFEVGVAPITGESPSRCSSTAWCTSPSFCWFPCIPGAFWIPLVASWRL